MRAKALLFCLIGGWIFVSASFAQAAEEKVFVIELRNGKLMSQKTMKVKRFDRVRWQVKSNEAGELHMHAYHIEIPVNPSKASDYVFEAKASGRFQLEWHPAQGGSTRASSSHHDPLALFEVYPQ